MSSWGWVKLETTFHDHRKTIDLTCTEVGLWTLCLSWCGAQDTDGFIPRRIALRFLGGEDGDLVVGRLLQSGLWDEVDGGYQMHAWEDHQATSEQRATLSARRAESGRLGGLAKAPQASAKQVLSKLPSKVLSKTQAEEKREDKNSPLPPSRGVRKYTAEGDVLARELWAGLSPRPVCGFVPFRERISEVLSAGYSVTALRAAVPKVRVWSRSGLEYALSSTTSADEPLEHWG